MEKKIIYSCFLGGLFLVIALFYISFAKSSDIPTKVYNSSTDEISIKSNGLEIANLKLNTPHINQVHTGDNVLIAEFNINNKEDYLGIILNNITFYNLRDNNKSLDRDFTYKLKQVNETTKIISYLDCSLQDNKTIIKCENINKEAKVNETIWKDLDLKSGLRSDNYTIGIFTDVQQGDYIEWIPTVYGIKISEWASWNASWILFANYTGIDDASVDLYYTGSEWWSQNFTTNSTGKFNITSAVVKLVNAGLTGSKTLTVSIRNAAQSGSDLSTGTAAFTNPASALYEINMTPYELQPSTTYSLITRCLNCSSGVGWLRQRRDTTSTYSGGVMSTSGDNGATWTMPFGTTGDFIFQIYGYINLPTNTCTYTSGNWNVVCSDNCTISTNTNLANNNITITGSGGRFLMNANITGFKYFKVLGGCNATCTRAGCATMN